MNSQWILESLKVLYWGPLLFLIYINDLHLAIKKCTTLHFADDTNLLMKNMSLKQLRKYLNLDLRNLCYWLKANMIQGGQQILISIFQVYSKYFQVIFLVFPGIFTGQRGVPEQYLLVKKDVKYKNQSPVILN